MLKDHDTGSFSPLAAERAVDELKRQCGIVIYEENGHAVGNFPAEFLDAALLAQWQSPSLELLITGARAQALGLGKQALRIRVQDLKLQDILALADPLAGPPPANIKSRPASEIDAAALTLAKYASLLPALLLTPQPPDGWLRVAAPDVQRYIAQPPVEVMETVQARLPVEGAENSRLVGFRARHGSAEHLALIVGDITAEDAPLTRVHSSCVTGDILGSLRCDCGDQLRMALAQISEAGQGVLLYLHQEGRGIGIINKLRAYRLQEQGFDTYDANRMLGFEEDERDFAIAAAMLKKLGVARVRLLTNNPQKIAALEKAGINISERVPLVAKSGKHNHGYLETKSKKAGHLF